LENPKLSVAAIVKMVRRIHPWNHKRIERVHEALVCNGTVASQGHSVKSNQKKKLFNQEFKNWQIGFIEDTYFGESSICNFLVFFIIGDDPHDVVGMEIAKSFPASKIIQALSWIMERKGTPDQITLTNITDRDANKINLWCSENDIKIWQSKGINFDLKDFEESYNKDRHSLDKHVVDFFDSLPQAVDWIEKWSLRHNAKFTQKTKTIRKTIL